MVKEFVGFIIEGKSQKRSSFIIDTDKKILASKKVGLFSGVLGNSGIVGALLSSSADILKKNNITIYNISNIISADFFRFGLTSKAIIIKTDTEEVKIFPENPNEILLIIQSMIKEK